MSLFSLILSGGYMDRREQILNGIIEFPPQILRLLNPSEDEEKAILLEELWDNLIHKFFMEQWTDSIVFYQKFNNPDFFNLTLTHLSKAGWITSIIQGDYAYILFNESKLIKWVTKEELINVKFQYKFIKYRLQATKSNIKDLVKCNNQYTKSGLIREGFMRAGNHRFSYDTKHMKPYIPEIAHNLMKGLTNSTKDITYQEIIKELVEYYSVENTEYTLGRNISDSRGRSIFDCTHKVFNPVSSKDARALIVCPSITLGPEDFEVIYAAIAELNDYRGLNWKDKVLNGEGMYLLREMPDLGVMELEQNYDDLHKRIWLERIYDNLDSYSETGIWNVPVEYDCLASAMQFIGVLTNDYGYMCGTNMIPDRNFEDVWTREYVSRKHVKKAMTPQIYGSAKHSKDLWDANKLEYTIPQLNKMEHDIAVGYYANACKFKDFIINNVKTKPVMHPSINGEYFTVNCNRFKWQETAKVEYFIYTTKKSGVQKVAKNLTLTPDPNQFKRYWATGLIHNLDSQVANHICMNVDWILPNHDAFVVPPAYVTRVRRLYIDWMFDLWRRRKEVLNTYFASIGISEEYKEMQHNGIINCFSPYCLK